jgi:hypothetical protein
MEAQADTDHRTIKRRLSNYHSRLTSQPQRPAVSKRSALGKRLRDLADAFAERLGGWRKLSVPLAADVRRAAELVVLSEKMRHDALRNGCADPDQLVKMEGAADRAVRRLGLNKHGQPKDEEPSLAEYLAAKYGERGDDGEA